MFENLLYQNVAKNLSIALKNNMLPNSLLFSGPENAGKLTCALELARILSCNAEGNKKGDWNCTCPSCQKHKALTSSDILVAGPKNCILEIAASKETFLNALKSNCSYIKASNYLFVRSVRKLTSHFNPVFYEGSNDAKKISPYIQEIDELLEELDPLNIEKIRQNTILDLEKIEKKLDDIYVQCQKLENNFMYSSIPVSHIRNASKWAQYTTVSSKKVLILENADKMNESSRNALLKILEEPPKDMIFILTTTKKSAIMPTILSRVRNYSFSERTFEQQYDVLSRVFHSEKKCSINEFLFDYLPVEKATIKNLAEEFLMQINHGQLIDVKKISEKANDFKPKIIFKIFLESLLENGGKKIKTQNFDRNQILYSEKQMLLLKKVQKCYDDVFIYNQSLELSLENLIGELAR